MTIMPHEVLDRPFSRCSIDEQLHWKVDRITKRGKDEGCFLFDVDLAPVYGEEAGRSFMRLINEIHR
jgi:hypothetical protein